MADDARKNLLSLLETMAALSPWVDPGHAAVQPFVDAFTRTRKQALAAVPAYLAAVETSQDKDLNSWLGDMTALKSWAGIGNPESAPFADAFSAARKRALAIAKEFAGGQ